MKPRFQADNDLRSSIRTGVLRHDPIVDFQSAHAALLDFLPDLAVLSFAALPGRILVSHDENTMPAHFSRFLESGDHSPGLLIVPQGAPVGRVIESILLIWTASEAEE